jgi:hypothetical protein
MPSEPFAVLSKPPHPHLDAGERTLAEATSRGETVVLTQRRLVIASADGESSTALAHIASLSVRFERLHGAILSGIVLAALAALLFAVASPVRTFFLTQSTSLEASVRQEQAQAAASDASLASALSRISGSLASASRSIPVFGVFLLVLGALNLGRGVYGRTVVTVFAGGGEVQLVRAGRNRPIEDFIKEVGRNLPGPAGR